MEMVYDFDTTPYFTTAANDLLRNHGQDAFIFARQALEKMKTLGHEEGLHMWQGIQSALLAQANLSNVPINVTRH